jgi:hypothetical protein
MRLNEDKTVDADDSLEAEPSEEFEVLDNEEAGVENDDSQSNSVETSQNKRRKQTPLNRKKIKARASADGERLDEAFRLLQSSANVMRANQDECFHFGNFIASKLRLYDDSTRSAIENDIFGIFQRASQGCYSHNSNSPGCSQMPQTTNTQGSNDSRYSDDFNVQEFI